MTLYINACARPGSRTDRLARALLATLGDYEELRLYDLPLLPLNTERLARRDALLACRAYDDDFFRCARQFAAADKIVLAAPLWDLCFPAQLKLYLENIYITGIVTRYDAAGCPVGLCRAQRLYYVSTSGGPYDPRFSYQYLRALCVECFGIPETELLMAENLDVDGSDPEAILRDAMSRYGLTPQP